MNRHYDADSYPADSLVFSDFIKKLVKNKSLVVSSFFSHIDSRNISVYDDIKIETTLCFSSVVSRVSMNFSDSPRKWGCGYRIQQRRHHEPMKGYTKMTNIIRAPYMTIKQCE